MDEQVNDKTEFVVRIVRIDKIQKHANADTLSITEVDGNPVVFKTGGLNEKCLALYVPIDALVPIERKEFAFLKGTSKKEYHRIKAAKLRGVFSMGLLVPFNELDIAQEEKNTFIQMVALNDLDTANKLTDWAGLLGIKKYISPEELRAEGHELFMNRVKEARKEKVKLPVYGLDSLRKFGGIFQEGEEVVVTEKIHGCNSRFVFAKGRLYVGSHRAMRGASPSRIGILFERIKLKVKALLGLDHGEHKIIAAGDIWWEVAQKYNLREKLAKKPNMVLYGEIYGKNVQDLTYDSPDGRKFRAFDVYDLDKGEFLSYNDFLDFLHDIDPFYEIAIVPTLYRGPYSQSLEMNLRENMNTAKSVLNDKQVAEGFVIKPEIERRDPRVGRVAMKYVGTGYMLRDEEKPRYKDGVHEKDLFPNKAKS
jgi:RNA ligase (TIGR02306 family)